MSWRGPALLWSYWFMSESLLPLDLQCSLLFPNGRLCPVTVFPPQRERRLCREGRARQLWLASDAAAPLLCR